MIIHDKMTPYDIGVASRKAIAATETDEPQDINEIYEDDIKTISVLPNHLLELNDVFVCQEHSRILNEKQLYVTLRIVALDDTYMRMVPVYRKKWMTLNRVNRSTITPNQLKKIGVWNGKEIEFLKGTSNDI